jgi:chromosomal replication initiation ATPase DnaA
MAPTRRILNELVEIIPMQDIFDEVEAVFGTKKTIGRNVKMYLSQKHTGEKLKDIGACFGIGESGVCQSSVHLHLGEGHD